MTTFKTVADLPHQLFGSDFSHNPYAVYERLRADGPVVRIGERGMWAVVGAAEARAVLKDAARFSSDRLAVARERMTAPHLAPLLKMLSHLMLQRDDPDHRRIRKLVHTAFERTAVERYASHLRELAMELLREPAAKGEIEFVSEFAVPLPILVISEIVGIPATDRKQVKAWCDAFSLVALTFYSGITDDNLNAGCDAVNAFNAYLADRIDAVRAAPDDTLLSALVAAESDGERLTHDDLVANVLLLLNAGNETTTILLTNACHQLMTSGALRRISADPSLIPSAVEEALRYEPPVQFIGRVATDTTDICGVTIDRGDIVFVMLGSACRDPSAFDRPDTFQMERTPNRHIAFGSGPHMCVGLQLARLEARIGLEAFAEVFGGAQMTDEPLRYGPNYNLRCLERLHCKLFETNSG